MTQFQLAFDFSAPAEPVVLGLDVETIEALANDSLPEISSPEIIAGITEPEQPPISEKPRCQLLVLPEREAPKGFNRDYRITDADEIGADGLKAKFENNLAAIRLLKQLEQEIRIEASPEEKRTLVRYCGWGALAQKAFSYNYEFYDLQRELQELLTEEEHTQASASSVNAHYTSPMVINAIWRAARRLGIQAQSRILEPAAGIGHFLDLQPEEIKSNSRVAVEIDVTSVAILRLLYPDTAVRACGFQQPGLPLNFFDLAISNVPFGKYGVHDIQFKSKPRLCSAIHDYFFAKALAHIRPGGLLAFITSRYTSTRKTSTSAVTWTNTRSFSAPFAYRAAKTAHSRRTLARKSPPTSSSCASGWKTKPEPFRPHGSKPAKPACRTKTTISKTRPSTNTSSTTRKWSSAGSRSPVPCTARANSPFWVTSPMSCWTRPFKTCPKTSSATTLPSAKPNPTRC